MTKKLTLREQKLLSFIEFTSQMKEILDKGIYRAEMAGVKFNKTKIEDLFKQMTNSIKFSIEDHCEEINSGKKIFRDRNGKIIAFSIPMIKKTKEDKLLIEETEGFIKTILRKFKIL